MFYDAYLGFRMARTVFVERHTYQVESHDFQATQDYDGYAEHEVVGSSHNTMVDWSLISSM